MKIYLNGEEKTLSSDDTIGTLLQQLQLEPHSFVVELNGNIPEKERYPSIQLKDGDRLELIRFVGGG